MNFCVNLNFFNHLELNIADTENPDMSKRQIQKQVPGKAVYCLKWQNI